MYMQKLKDIVPYLTDSGYGSPVRSPAPLRLHCLECLRVWQDMREKDPIQMRLGIMEITEMSKNYGSLISPLEQAASIYVIGKDFTTNKPLYVISKI